MRAPRKLTVVVFGAVLAYLAALFAFTLAATDVPTIGWIGFAIVALIALGAATAATRLFGRVRVSARRTHGEPGDRFRVLVVVDSTEELPGLCAVVGSRVAGRRAEVRVVAPAVVGALHFLTDDEQREEREAGVRLARALRALAAVGIPAVGATTVADDPLVAIGDALAAHPADEIVVEASARRTWLEEHVEAEIRDLFGVHVVTVTADTAPVALR